MNSFRNDRAQWNEPTVKIKTMAIRLEMIEPSVETIAIRLEIVEPSVEI